MLRNIGLLDAQPLLNHAGRKLAIAQHFDNRDAGGMTQSLKNARLIGPEKVLLQLTRIFDLTNMCNCFRNLGLGQ